MIVEDVMRLRATDICTTDGAMKRTSGPEALRTNPKKVKPIPPGGTALIRISLDKADIGKLFRTAKVELIEGR
jgi:hypothetical protein